MITDAHAHIGRVRSRAFSADDLLRRMDDAGIDRTVVFSFVERIDNYEVARAAAVHSDRLIPFAVINPWDDNAEFDAQRWSDAGFRGLKLHPVRHGYPLDRRELVDPLLEIAAASRWPVISFGGDDYFTTPDRFVNLARRHPDVDFIMAHMGFSNGRDGAQRAAAEMPNIYVETSGVRSQRYITGAVRAAGAGKVVFGSNCPHEDHAESLTMVRQSVPEEHHEAVLHDNLTRLLAKRTYGET